MVTTDEGVQPVIVAAHPALLEILALLPKRLVAQELLCSGSWSESPPPTATKALQTYVSQPRRLLLPRSLSTAGGAPVLEVDAGSVDASLFEDVLRSWSPCWIRRPAVQWLRGL